MNPSFVHRRPSRLVQACVMPKIPGREMPTASDNAIPRNRSQTKVPAPNGCKTQRLLFDNLYEGYGIPYAIAPSGNHVTSPCSDDFAEENDSIHDENIDDFAEENDSIHDENISILTFETEESGGASSTTSSSFSMQSILQAAKNNTCGERNICLIQCSEFHFEEDARFTVSFNISDQFVILKQKEVKEFLLAMNEYSEPDEWVYCYGGHNGFFLDPHKMEESVQWIFSLLSKQYCSLAPFSYHPLKNPWALSSEHQAEREAMFRAVYDDPNQYCLTVPVWVPPGYDKSFCCYLSEEESS